MSDIALLWFRCKNVDCGYVPKDVAIRNRKAGISKYAEPKRRHFMRYAEGVYKYYSDGSIIFLSNKYGDIIMYDAFDRANSNSHIYPIDNMEYCNVCIKKFKNEQALFGDMING